MSKVEHVPFDQYQRYAIVSQVVSRFLTDSSHPIRILEVGANSHKLLKRFLPDVEILFLDREIPEALACDPDFVLGDATALQYPDSSFDFVVALDVFEHIPEDKRSDFLRETGRVAAKLAILAAPFKEIGVAEAENEADELWVELFGSSYRWLEEHKVCGLPSVNETSVWLDSEGFAHSKIAHGSLALWKNMLRAHFSKEYLPEAASVVMEIDKFYNKNIFPRDFQEPAYRNFFFYGRDLEAVNDAVSAVRELDQGGQTHQCDSLFENILAALPEIAKSLCHERKELANCKSSIGALEQDILAKKEAHETAQASVNLLTAQVQAAMQEVEIWKSECERVAADLTGLRRFLLVRLIEKILRRKHAKR